jgi:hypothetical protein
VTPPTVHFSSAVTARPYEHVDPDPDLPTPATPTTRALHEAQIEMPTIVAHAWA